MNGEVRHAQKGRASAATWHILMNKVSQTWHMDKNKLHEACNGLMTYNRTWFCKRIVLYLHISTLMECIIRSQTKNKAFSHEETSKPSSSKAFPFFLFIQHGKWERCKRRKPYKSKWTLQGRGNEPNRGLQVTSLTPPFLFSFLLKREKPTTHPFSF